MLQLVGALLLLLLLLLTAIGLSPGGSGYFTCKQNMKLVKQNMKLVIPQAVTHSLVLLKMGKIIARNMLS